MPLLKRYPIRYPLETIWQGVSDKPKYNYAQNYPYIFDIIKAHFVFIYHVI